MESVFLPGQSAARFQFTVTMPSLVTSPNAPLTVVNGTSKGALPSLEADSVTFTVS